uniref:Uncharacterized protein n=1 Tax=Fagus sylvatica TaxID=28930 RepID=A0A2N9G066_FAGSY
MDINIFSDRLTKLLTGKKTSLNEVKDQIHMLHKDIKNMCSFLVKVDGAEHAILGPSSRKWWNFPIRLMMLLTDTWSTPNCSIRANTTSRRIGNGYLTFFVGKEKERQLISKEPRMVGRGAEMEKLLDLLIEGDPQLAIISIVGEAGLGKTTLAAEAYNSVYVKNYFDCRARVHVSSKSTANEILKERRFLIVFDNVSETDLPGNVKKAFPDDGNGSRLLLTTTAKWMAHEGQPRNLHLALSSLDEDQSWEMLVSNMVFEHNNCPLALEDFGGFEDSLMMLFSYNDLPDYLKPCLLYFAIFPEDSKVSTRQLFQLWIAEGFIHENFEATAETELSQIIEAGRKQASWVNKISFLTHLTLLSTELKDDPMPTLENLPMLLVLKLKHNSYSGRKLACTSGKFPCLQVLHLKSMQWLEEWTMEPGAMPELVSLVINPCAYLRRHPEELWRVKTFCKLELWWPRPELKPKLREFEDMDQYDIQIHPSGL